jgi:hypothetical protein
MTNGKTEGFWQAAERAQDRVQTYFDDRAKRLPDVPNQHDIDGIKQLICDAALMIKSAAEGKAWAQKGRDPATYLAERIVSSTEGPQLSHSKKAERRFALEMLADELGIKDDVLKSLASHQGKVSR